MQNNITLAEVADFEDGRQHVLDVGIVDHDFECEVGLVDAMVVRPNSDCVFETFKVFVIIFFVVF